jgi:hypothetical protein
VGGKVAKPDKLFKQTYTWFKQSVEHVLNQVQPADQIPAAQSMVWQMLGVLNAAAPPADPDLDDFANVAAAPESLAVAVQIIAESLVALDMVKQGVDSPQGDGRNAILGLIAPVMQQIENLSQGLPKSRYPSAFSLGKILLTLSGDAQANPVAGHEAEKLAKLLGANDDAQNQDTQAALGILVLLSGSMIDRSFSLPTGNPLAGWSATPIPLPALPAPHVSLPFQAIPGSIDINFKTDAPTGLETKLDLKLNQPQALGDSGFSVGLTASSTTSIFLPILPSGQAQTAGDFALNISLARTKDALTIGSDALDVKLVIGELGAALNLRNDAPNIAFFAYQGKATFRPTDSFLKLILGEGIALDFAVEAEADQFGKVRLKNGTGLKASLPVPTLPTGPFDLQLINLELKPDLELEPVNGDFHHLQVELSASFGVELGPFQASIDRLGMMLNLDILNAPPTLDFDFKPPNGIGLSLDAGIVKGGGYLYFDRAEYAGTLELNMLAVGVKAIAILSTRTDVGFSLLLLIHGQFPAIQLSFGFTLTGIGGLIGVQHTASPPALSQGISNGSLDAILFPANPVGDTPKIINTLRTLFPVIRGGFVIGPMLELGWGTPSLVTVRLGLLVEASQFVILGQAIVQLPPAVTADLALLYLRLDFVGSVVFSPLRIAFDAKLVNSRVAFITITGQFAFRADFGEHPTFLISAGGFHPRFKEVPSDIPAPFDRVGASFDIGIIGLSYKGYFAITSATVQAGSELRVWADIGIASIEGGFGFDAICYLKPKFYFEVDLYAYLAVEVFDLDFAAIRLEGHLAGPGRWRIAGQAKVETPWPLPDFTLSVDESWGTDRETPAITVNIAELLSKEIDNIANWSAQLPKGGEGYLTLADVKPGTDLLAHPLGSLLFLQKLVPLELRLAKASGSKIIGANEFGSARLTFTQDLAPLKPPTTISYKDFFASAQFLEMSQDDRLTKPSFEAYPAGFELSDDSYDLGAIVPADLGYEEADLGALRKLGKKRFFSKGLFLESHHGALMQFGSAGLSSLRDKALAQPMLPAAIKVNPPPVVVVDKSSLQLAATTQHSSVWQAEQVRRFTPTFNPTLKQVAELAELTT